MVGGDYEIGIAAFLRGVRSINPSTVVLTDGLDNTFVGTADEILFCPAIQVEAMGTPGASDAFAATFSALIALGLPVEDALIAAAPNAASVVTFADIKSGRFRLEELDGRIGDARSRQPVRRWRL